VTLVTPVKVTHVTATSNILKERVSGKGQGALGSVRLAIAFRRPKQEQFIPAVAPRLSVLCGWKDT